MKLKKVYGELGLLVICPWCGQRVRVEPGFNLCPKCHHRADVSKDQCDCDNCLEGELTLTVEGLRYSQRYQPGAERIRTGACPMGMDSMRECGLCGFGHVTECHYPRTCAQAGCNHMQKKTRGG